MKYRIIYCFLFVFASCSNINERAKKNNEISPVLREYFRTIPAYASFIYAEEDSFLFGFNKGATDYDTSWTLLINKSGNLIHGQYNQLLPYTVTGFDDYLDESSKLLYHEGFSFEINKSRWDSIVNLSGLNAYNVQDTIRYRGCPHCPSYTAYYNSKIILNSKLDNYFLIKLDSLLHRTIINNFFEKRSTPPIKFQK